MRFGTAWAMPSKWTFQIEPIQKFLHRHLNGCKTVVDPFSGTSVVGTHRNDLAHGGCDAAEFCERLYADGLVADAVIFDPPYSPRQIAECYKGIGRKATVADTQSAVLYANVRRPLSLLLKPGGIALSFGWQSGGFGVSWETMEILLVQHGGAHNDTICVAQRKPMTIFDEVSE